MSRKIRGQIVILGTNRTKDSQALGTLDVNITPAKSRPVPLRFRYHRSRSLKSLEIWNDGRFLLLLIPGPVGRGPRRKPFSQVEAPLTNEEI